MSLVISLLGEVIKMGTVFSTILFELSVVCLFVSFVANLLQLVFPVINTVQNLGADVTDDKLGLIIGLKQPERSQTYSLFIKDIMDRQIVE